MARPVKQGLDYFPFDVNFFDDDKLAFVSERFGEKGEVIAVKLLCKIYKDNGYYLGWTEDEALLFAKRVVGPGQHSLVNDVVHELVKRGFFDKDIFNRFKILTSRGIQSRYNWVVLNSKLKRNPINSEHLVKPSEEKPITSEESTQRKVQESIGNESKVNKRESAPDLNQFENWTREIISGQDFIFHQKFRNEFPNWGGGPEKFNLVVNDHLDLLGRYPNMNPNTQERFRNSVIKHFREFNSKQNGNNDSKRKNTNSAELLEAKPRFSKSFG